MIGVMIGDIAGSRFERLNHRSKDFDLFAPRCRVTDDSVLTLAIAAALLRCNGDFSELAAHATEELVHAARAYPLAGYGGSFVRWAMAAIHEPYNSWGNGAAMRVSPCAYAASSLEEAKELSRMVTAVTHNHPEGIKGAEATTVAVYMALHGASKEAIRACICDSYYALDFTIDEIRPTYQFDVSCQGSVPQALEAFFESTDLEDAVRLAVSIGGDSDTIAAIAGSVAEAYYGVPEELRAQALTYLDESQRAILDAFEARYPVRRAD